VLSQKFPSWWQTITILLPRESKSITGLLISASLVISELLNTLGPNVGYVKKKIKRNNFYGWYSLG
jgi:hypothetical protein